MNRSTEKSGSSTRSKRARSKRIATALATFIDDIERHLDVDLTVTRKRRRRQILSSKQAARLMRLSPKTLANWRNLGQGPAFYKIGGRVVYQRADVLVFCKSRKSQSTSQYGALGENGGRNDG